MTQKAIVLNTIGNTQLPSANQFPYFFTTYPSNTLLAQAMTAYAKSKNLTDVGTLDDSTQYGAELASDVKAAVAKAGVTFVAEQSYPSTAIDVRRLRRRTCSFLTASNASAAADGVTPFSPAVGHHLVFRPGPSATSSRMGPSCCKPVVGRPGSLTLLGGNW
jgi:ABC-type branched-subunit amino acid transport system substrate-binding protein